VDWRSNFLGTQCLYLSAISCNYINGVIHFGGRNYNYLLEAGFDSGVALSALVQVFALRMETAITGGETISQKLGSTGKLQSERNSICSSRSDILVVERL